MVLGTGKIKNVLTVPTDGPSMLLENVSPLPINAELTMPMEIVDHATRAMTSLKENVSSRNPTMLNLPTSDVELGIGIIKSA